VDRALLDALPAIVVLNNEHMIIPAGMDKTPADIQQFGWNPPVANKIRAKHLFEQYHQSRLAKVSSTG